MSFPLVLTNTPQLAAIDHVDVERVTAFKWLKHKKGYICRTRRPFVKLSDFIMGNISSRGFLWDHKSGSKLDNRRFNLRAATVAQNSRNRKVSHTSASGFKGVFWKSDHNKWCAQISIDHKQIVIGYFSSPEEAARKYDEAAKKYHGEFARLNFKEV